MLNIISRLKYITKAFYSEFMIQNLISLPSFAYILSKPIITTIHYNYNTWATQITHNENTTIVAIQPLILIKKG